MNEDRYRPPVTELETSLAKGALLMTIAALVLSHFAVAWLGYKLGQPPYPLHSVGVEEPWSSPVDKILDGETAGMGRDVTIHTLVPPR